MWFSYCHEKFYHFNEMMLILRQIWPVRLWHNLPIWDSFIKRDIISLNKSMPLDANIYCHTTMRTHSDKTLKHWQEFERAINEKFLFFSFFCFWLKCMQMENVCDKFILTAFWWRFQRHHWHAFSTCWIISYMKCRFDIYLINFD